MTKRFAVRVLAASALLAGTALAGAVLPSPPHARPSAPPSPAGSKDHAMTAQPCANDALSRSACMIGMILKDVTAHFGGRGGGGIAQIKAASSTSYTVSLPREERVELLTYEFAVADGSVTLIRRVEGVQSF